MKACVLTGGQGEYTNLKVKDVPDFTKIGEEELHTKEGEVVSPLSLRWFVAKIAIDQKQDELIKAIEENKMLRKR